MKLKTHPNPPKLISSRPDYLKNKKHVEHKIQLIVNRSDPDRKPLYFCFKSEALQTQRNNTPHTPAGVRLDQSILQSGVGVGYVHTHINISLCSVKVLLYQFTP